MCYWLESVPTNALYQGTGVFCYRKETEAERAGAEGGFGWSKWLRDGRGGRQNFCSCIARQQLGYDRLPFTTTTLAKQGVLSTHV